MGSLRRVEGPELPPGWRSEVVAHGYAATYWSLFHTGPTGRIAEVLRVYEQGDITLFGFVLDSGQWTVARLWSEWAQSLSYVFPLEPDERDLYPGSPSWTTSLVEGPSGSPDFLSIARISPEGPREVARVSRSGEITLGPEGVDYFDWEAFVRWADWAIENAHTGWPTAEASAPPV